MCYPKTICLFTLEAIFLFQRNIFSLQHFFQPISLLLVLQQHLLLVVVRLHVKTGEENEVDDGVDAVVVGVVHRVARLREHKEDRVEEEDDELGNLQLRQVPFPPEKGRHGGALGRQCVIAEKFFE